MRTITFFNSRAGIGKTRTIYHVSWMLAKLNVRTVVIDLDPQARLTQLFLSDDRFAAVYRDQLATTIQVAVRTIIEAGGQQPHIEELNDNLGLVMGDPALSSFEETFSAAWFKCLTKDRHSFEILNVFNTIADEVGRRFEAEVVLIDTGSNLGALNRMAVLHSDYVIMPLGYDFLSIHGIKNLGQTLANWKEQWDQRQTLLLNDVFSYAHKRADPAGYIVLQYAARGNLSIRPDVTWSTAIPGMFSKFVCGTDPVAGIDVGSDRYCIGQKKDNRSLNFLSRDAGKPTFLLGPADGAGGLHMNAVQESYEQYRALTRRILERCP